MLDRLFLFTVIAAVSLTGCKRGSTKPFGDSSSSRQMVRINIAYEPQTLDPRKVRALSDANLLHMFMEGLTRIDKEGKPSLALAERIEISDDGKNYTITLRNGKWSNGDPITSYDFIYAWKASLSPEFNAPNANLLYYIKNAQEVKMGKLPLSLLGLDIIDSKTFTVELSYPIPFFFELLAHPIFYPVNAKLDKENPYWAENGESYVTCGPFSMKQWKHHNSIEAKKNDDYWDSTTVQLQHLKMVMVSEDTGFKMFETKELDWEGSPFSMIPFDAIETLKGEQRLHTKPILGTQWIRINTAIFPFDSCKMRRAFGLAIDRQSIVNYVTQGEQIAATGIVPQTMGLNEEPYFKDGDVESARELFNEALAEKGITREQLPEIILTYGTWYPAHRIAQAVQQQWLETLGVLVRLEPVESKVLFDRLSKTDYILSLGNWFADFNDPINFLEVFKTKEVGTNNTNWGNPCYTELLETSYRCKDSKERFEILRQSEELLIKEMPVIPLYDYTLLYVKQDQLRDVVLTGLGNMDFKWARFEEKGEIR